ncbi:hypothetical protein BVC80_1597g3 [Macleaya cordata]|uniref:Uncharacterized protein n=1 Tax=Macleaya cordata TaxID=56857 RepID=A0A200QIG5_MACCD|nr:hypothetical protein BVC80_1597g3 [Macleaya cordata]
MANSTSDFNLPEFKEYDPTPYGGGYDQTLTYGKPLPPSDSICYPPSFSSHSNSPSPNGFSYGSIPSPYGTTMVDQTSKPQNGPSPNRPYKEEEKEKKNPGYDGNGNWVNGPNYWGEDIFSNGYGYGYGYGSCGNGHGSCYGQPVDSYPTEGYFEKEGFSEIGYDYQRWSNFGYGRDEDNCNYGRQEPQDDLGPCPSIFGYWHCLSKKYQKMYCQQNGDEQESHGNQWKGTAEYLFGRSLYPYGERKDEDVSYPCYAYERHHQEQLHSVQVEYNEQSWFRKPGYYEAYQVEESPAFKYESSESDLIIHHGYERHHKEQPHFVQVEYNEQSCFQKQGYHETYEEEEYPGSEYVRSESNLITHHGYERHYQEQPHFVQVDYNEQWWLQKPGHHEAYQEEEYPASKYVSS